MFQFWQLHKALQTFHNKCSRKELRESSEANWPKMFSAFSCRQMGICECANCANTTASKCIYRVFLCLLAKKQTKLAANFKCIWTASKCKSHLLDNSPWQEESFLSRPGPVSTSLHTFLRDMQLKCKKANGSIAASARATPLLPPPTIVPSFEKPKTKIDALECRTQTEL